MRIADHLLALADRLSPPSTVHAHCDLPCGVYDPAQARIEAESVKATMEKYNASNDEAFKVRAILIKEERSDLVKHHLWVLWTDYFKPEHLKRFPDLHDMFWKATKTAGEAKKTNDVAVADRLLLGDRRHRQDVLGVEEVGAERAAQTGSPGSRLARLGLARLRRAGRRARRTGAHDRQLGQAFVTDQLAAPLAPAIGAVLQAGERLLDLVEERVHRVDRDPLGLFLTGRVVRGAGRGRVGGIRRDGSRSGQGRPWRRSRSRRLPRPQHLWPTRSPCRAAYPHRTGGPPRVNP